MEKRKPRSARRLLTAVLCAGTLLLAVREWRLLPDGKLHAWFLDVGQGDSALLVTPSGRQILIDGGPDLSALEAIGKRMSFFDRSIDLLVLSHPNLDHLASFPEVLRRYRIGAVLMTRSPYELARYKEFLTELELRRIPVLLADPARDLDLGDGVLLDVVWPDASSLAAHPVRDANNASIVLRVLHRDRAILFTGDMEEEEERTVLASGADLDADVLKVAHHGSKSSTSTGFLLAVTPNLAIISVGDGNRYGHPHPAILERLRHFGVTVKTTMERGDVEVVF